MVSGADHHGRTLRDGRRAPAGYPSELRTDLLQLSQATCRLGEPELSPSRFFGGGGVEWRYLRCELQ
jgi:hypothetical protein